MRCLVAILSVFLSLASAAQAESTIHRLSQSTADLTLWTTPPTERVFKDDPVPAAVDGEVRVYAARNELEPFQIVARPSATGPVSVSIGSFGGGVTTELNQVRYVPIVSPSDNLGRTGDYPDPLWPLPLPATVDLTAGTNTALWFTVSVPPGAPSGDYVTTVQVGAVSVPVRLHVFAFSIPDTLHVRSELSVAYTSILNSYSVPPDPFSDVDRLNQFFIDRRLTPTAFTYPGGVAGSSGAPFVSYDCAGHLIDNDGIWGFESQAAKYLGGVGFNDGAGFPSYAAVSSPGGSGTTDPRPASFCGIPRGAADWVSGNDPNTPYNVKWREYVAAMRNYLAGLGYLDHSYFHVGSEPGAQGGYDGVAWYAQLLKSAAPDLDLVVSEQPRPEIFDHPSFTGAKIDTWIAPLDNFDPAVSGARLQLHDEATWLYFLKSTRTPRFNPITLDHPGIEAKLTGWFLWKHRVGGIAHYSASGWSANPWTNPSFDGHNGERFLIYPPSMTNTPIPYGSNGHRFVPSIRLELLRDGLEDYEYLYLLNGGPPEPGVTGEADALASRIVGGVTAYCRDGAYAYELRRQLGLYLGGETAQLPDALPPSSHARAQGAPDNYYINFQDPAGQPLANPLIVNGNTYMKVGWQPYSATLGYGWYGDFTQALFGYFPAGPDDLQRSAIYDDFGRIKTFDLDLPNGLYQVTVSVGRQGGTDLHNKVVIEGVSFIDDEASSPYLVRTASVWVQDHKLTLEMGLPGEYTMLDYLDIVTIDADGDGLPNDYEQRHACLDSIAADGTLDPDHDLLSNVAEYSAETDPCVADSDGGRDNDGSELLEGRSPFDPADDLDLTLAARRSGATKVILAWSDGLGRNAEIRGPYLVYRGTTLPLGPADLLREVADGAQETSDVNPPCSPCFYQVWNTPLP